MRTFVPVAFLAAILSLLAPPLQAVLQQKFRQHRWLILASAGLLLAIFYACLVWSGTFTLPFAVLVAAYVAVPSMFAYVKRDAPFGWDDFIVILALWLPLELAVGSSFIPREFQGFVNNVARGVAILLALLVFLIVRRFGGMKYRLPASSRDFALPVIAFLCVAPFLIVIGLWLHFLAPFHAPVFGPLTILERFVLILVGTALPEEILFRALIQNWLMQKFGETNRILFVAALIFGLSHLNNSPGPLPNWRYAILATIAGYAYGKVFQRASSIFSSATLHAMVNTVRHVCF